MSAGSLAREIHSAGLGNPNATALKEAVRKTGLVVARKNGFTLKTLARHEIGNWLNGVLARQELQINHASGFLPEDVWKHTRGYVEKVCVQLNGCYECRFFDAVAVLVRRLVETLIIEAFEHCRHQDDLKTNGEYMMLKGLIGVVKSSTAVHLGREAKAALDEFKELGDRSAHNRKYNAVKADLDRVRSGLRVLVDELINSASLRRASN